VELTIELAEEEKPDERWLAAVPELPGVMVYGKSRGEALTRATALALRTAADRLEAGECAAPTTVSFTAHLARRALPEERHRSRSHRFGHGLDHLEGRGALPALEHRDVGNRDPRALGDVALGEVLLFA